MNKDALVISPVYNEQKYINSFYAQLRSIYKKDLVFVDDGSTDESKDFLKKVKNFSTFLIRHPRRKGYGAALISGFEFAKENNYKKVVTLDVDLQHRPSHIPDFLKQLDQCQAVLGSRYIDMAGHLDVPQDRFAINRYISRVIKNQFGWRFTDPFCGFRAYRLNFLKKIVCSNAGYGIALEILLELINKKAKFCELSVEAIYFKDQRKFLDGLDNPGKRLAYYLEVISKKAEKLYGKEAVSFYQPSS